MGALTSPCNSGLDALRVRTLLTGLQEQQQAQQKKKATEDTATQLRAMLDEALDARGIGKATNGRPGKKREATNEADGDLAAIEDKRETSEGDDDSHSSATRSQRRKQKLNKAKAEAQAELEEYKARALEAESQLDYLNRHHKDYCSDNDTPSHRSRRGGLEGLLKEAQAYSRQTSPEKRATDARNIAKAAARQELANKSETPTKSPGRAVSFEGSDSDSALGSLKQAMAIVSSSKRQKSTPQQVADDVLGALKDLVESGSGYENHTTLPKDIEKALEPTARLIAKVIDDADTKSKRINRTKLLEGVADSCGQRVRRGEELLSVVTRVLYALMRAGVDPTSNPVLATLGS